MVNNPNYKTFYLGRLYLYPLKVVLLGYKVLRQTQKDRRL